MTNFKVKILKDLLKIKFNKFLFRNRINVLQKKKWKKKEEQLLKSSFYRKLVEEKTAFENYPIINKSVFMSNFDDINTVGISFDKASELALKAEKTRDFSPEINKITIGLSSGTSGNRGIFLASETERALWVANILDRVIGLSLKKRKVAFFLRANSNLYTSVSSKLLQFVFFDLMIKPEVHINSLNKLQPDILVAQPSMLLLLGKYIEKGKLKINPSKVISVAEVLYEEDAVYLKNVFGQTIRQVYQCTEGFLASTCDYGILHFHEDMFIIEKKYLDDNQERFHPLITDLERTSQPVIRYELNDIIHEMKNCPCGSNHLAIKRIEGRSDDVFEFVDVNDKIVRIFPDFFRRAIIQSSEHIMDYYLIKEDNVTLKLYVDNNQKLYNSAKQALVDLLCQFEVNNVRIIRMEHKEFELGNKFRRIKNA